MDLAFGFLALGGGTIDIGIWKGKDPWNSMEVHLIKSFPFVRWKTDKVETKYIALGWKIEHY